MIDDRSSTSACPRFRFWRTAWHGRIDRLVDKRKVRRDLADMFCTTAEGVRADRARGWKLVDHVFKPQQFGDLVKSRALELARQSDRPGGAGVALAPLGESRLVEVKLDPAARTAEISVRGPEKAVLERNADWYRCVSRASSIARSSTFAAHCREGRGSRDRARARDAAGTSRHFSRELLFRGP